MNRGDGFFKGFPKKNIYVLYKHTERCFAKLLKGVLKNTGGNMQKHRDMITKKYYTVFCKITEIFSAKILKGVLKICNKFTGEHFIAKQLY